MSQSNSYKSAKELVDQGKQKHKEGKYDEAIKYYEKAHEIDPNYVDALEEKARSLLYLGKDEAAKYYYVQAKKCCENIVETLESRKTEQDAKEEIVEALATKAELCNSLGEHEEALTSSKKATSLDDKSIEAWNNKGESFMFLKLYDEAIECYDKAIKLSVGKDKLAESYNGKGKNLYLLKKYDEALECFNKALETSDNKDEYAYNNKGKCLLEKCDKNDNKAPEYLEEAIRCFKEATTLWPKYAEANRNMAISYLKRGILKYEREEYGDALADFKEIKDDNLKTEKCNNIGLCCIKMGQNRDAEQHFIDAINSSNLKAAYPLYNLGILYNNTNTPDAAKTLFDNCLKINRGFTHAYQAIKTIEGSHQLDWYAWWFGVPKQKKVKNTNTNTKKNIKKEFRQESFKKGLGIGLIAIILFPIVFIVYSVLFGKSLNTNDITGLTVMTGFLVALLLLPSLTKFKVATLEMETISPVMKPIELEPELADVPLEEFRKLTSRH